MMQKKFPDLSTEQRVRKLEWPSGKVKMVLDTDTFNEIDDQFAVIYSLLSPERIQCPSTVARTAICLRRISP
ncbi:hypothetical protein AB4Z21_14915 [Paenibacillus sp. MCAF20]